MTVVLIKLSCIAGGSYLCVYYNDVAQSGYNIDTKPNVWQPKAIKVETIKPSST